VCPAGSLVVVTSHSTSPLIVVGIDGSAESVRALRWAARYACASHGKIRAILAWQYPPPIGPAPTGAPAGVTREIGQRMRDLLAETVVAGAAGVPVEQQVCPGHPAQVLLEQARHADLLVVGARGHAPVSGMFLGSVSVHCVTHSRCPVVVVRGRQ